MSQLMGVSVSNLAVHLIAKRAQIDKVKAIENPERFVELLVRAYNASKERGVHKDHVFHKVETPTWNRKEHHNCFLLAYYSRRHHVSEPGALMAKLAGESRGTFENTGCHFAYFIYFVVGEVKRSEEGRKSQKVWALFALTSGQAFRLTRPYCDYAFPTSVAFRVVQASCLRKEVTPLVGTKEATTSHYKKPYELKTHEYESLWVVFRNFDSQFNPDSSVHTLLGISDKKELGVHIGEGMLRIGSSLDFDHYLLLLRHFLDIRMGRPTRTASRELEEDDPDFQIFANIQRVNPKEKKKLDTLLVEVLWKAVTDREFSTTLYLSHRRYREYYRSTEFELRIVGKIGDLRTPWSYRPTFEQLVEGLRTVYKHAPLQDFQSAVDRITIKCNGIDNTYHPLIEFLQGELVLEEDVYFKVGGEWLKVQGQHLATTERAFHQLIGDCLVKSPTKGGHVLRTPWVSKERWVSFSSRDLPDDVSKTAYTEAVEVLTDQKFRFVDQDGKVVVPYLTRAILRNQELKIVKSLKKKWDELSTFLKENKGKVVRRSAIKGLFPKTYRKVFELLQTPYPICAPLQARSGTIAPLAADGSVQLKKFDLLQIGSSAPKGVKEYVEELSQALSTQETITEESLDFIARKDSRRGALKWLKEKHRLTEEASKQYVFQGPLPEGMTLLDSLKEFFQERHEEFRLVMDEENYNRLYLGKGNYLVFDQVFPGKRDKIEVFDLLYFGEKGKLYLYAIKEGFGTSTGIACTQIRTVAEALSAKNAGGRIMLENLYDQAISTEATSSFRKKLIEDLKKLTKQEFVDLFMKREIVFVYAFLDTNNEDRRLENELDLCVAVPRGALRHATHSEDESEETLLVDLLTAMGYLDGQQRLKDYFLRNPKSDVFQEKFPSFAKKVWEGHQGYSDRRSFFKVAEVRGTEAQKSLSRALLQLGYLGGRGATAKVQEKTEEEFTQELLCFDPETVHKVLWRMVSQFDSMIAKIELIKLRGDLAKHGFTLQIQQLNRPGPQADRALFNMTRWGEESVSYFGTEKVMILGKEHFYQKHPKTLEEIFMLLMGQEDLYLAQRLLYEKTKDPSDALLSPGCLISEELVQTAAALGGTSLVIHDVDHPDQTKSVEDALILVKRGEAYFWVEGMEPPAPPEDEELEAIAGEFNESYLPDSPVGLGNRGNDCFLNAMLQLLVHSPLAIPMVTGPKENQASRFFLSFILGYAQENPPPTCRLRKPIHMSAAGQEDVQEALTLFLDSFEFDADALPLLRMHKEVGGETAVEVLDKDPNEFSPLQNVIDTESYSPMLPMPIAEGDKPSFDDCWEAFETQDSDESFSYSQGAQVFQVTPSQVEYELQNEPSTLLIYFLRYRQDPKTGKILKISTPVEIPQEIEIGGSVYEVGGFINHEGDTPHQGHYTCHVKKEEQWFECNDASVIEKEDITEALSTSYILMLRRF